MLKLHYEIINFRLFYRVFWGFEDFFENLEYFLIN